MFRNFISNNGPIHFFAFGHINFRSTFIDETNGDEISDTWLMAINYIKGYFIFDLVAIIPFELFLEGMIDYKKQMK